jgi:hypothetical protein
MNTSLADIPPDKRPASGEPRGPINTETIASSQTPFEPTNSHLNVRRLWANRARSLRSLEHVSAHSASNGTQFSWKISTLCCAQIPGSGKYAFLKQLNLVWLPLVFIGCSLWLVPRHSDCTPDLRFECLKQVEILCFCPNTTSPGLI